MEKILISAGIILSLGGVWLMILASIYKDPDSGKKWAHRHDPKQWMVNWGWICLIVGVIAQLVGIWLPQLSQLTSSAFASTPAVKNTPEAEGNSLFYKILKDPALIIGGFALIVAFWSVITARKTMRGHLYIRLLEEYASTEMCSALRMLKGAHENILKEEKRRGIEVENFETIRLAEPDKVEEARRLVKYYFFKALRLYKLRFLSKKLMKEIGSVAGINILYDVVKKFETDPNAKTKIEKIRKICGSYEY
jgi:hypothetical protein